MNDNVLPAPSRFNLNSQAPGRILALAARSGITLDSNGNFAPNPTTEQVVSLANPTGGAASPLSLGVNIVDPNAKHLPPASLRVLTACHAALRVLDSDASRCLNRALKALRYE